MNDARSQFRSSISSAQAEELDRFCDEFEEDWRAGKQPQIEAFLLKVPADLQAHLLRELIATEVDLRREQGDDVSEPEYRDRFADQHNLVRDAFVLAPEHIADESLVSTFSVAQSADTDAPAIMPTSSPEMPERIDRYRVERVLGSGKFGVVYLAHDPQLDRPVAIKVPLRERIGGPADIERYIAEARHAASLDHPGIVRVHDVQQDGDTLFVVQQYVKGQSLSEAMKARSMAHERVAEITAAVAEAMAYAHKHLVHRDLKPDNILLDEDGVPRVADFGLAVHKSVQHQLRGERAGSPAFMSPEAVRGETHRLDGRSDIWSLGVILYEMLAKCRPFTGSTLDALFDEIQYREPRPPRQRDVTIPTELDRICTKCLEKRMTDRYGTALDLAEDLRHWLARPAEPVQATGPEQPSQDRVPQSVRIVPRGLRSFDERDADAFLELLPGPRDRDGLPPTIRFWKTRIEEMDADETFPVGVMYGPSGCGKSSLVKAGLLPRVADHIVPAYVEATPGETEIRLLKRLKKCVPRIPDDRPLPEVLGGLRETGLDGGRKLLLVLDQFEQWLHAHGDEPSNQLLHALRQCDGGHVQCLVLVREEYAMPCLRFLDQLDMAMREDENFGTVDLFDQRHAEKVLRLFGTAFGALPEADRELSTAQQEFITQSTQQLADEKDRVICVRLALFAEMIKAKPWVPSSLTELGGAHGVGVTFLEESLSAESAKPTHRLHQKAAREVLKRLLPDSETEGIKGSMCSHADLVEVSGYARRPADCDTVIHILDSELRLITPTDATGGDADESDSAGSAPDPGAGGDHQASPKHYQLTHDYLVPSLRDWLTRKQRETRKGRAELKLDERAATWSAQPENKQLPTLWEWLSIRTLTTSKRWTESQRKMMGRAGRFHLSRGLAVAVLMGLISAAGLWTWNRVEENRRDMAVKSAQEQEATRMEGLVGRLLSAEPNQIGDIVDQLNENVEVASTYLTPVLTANPTTIEERREQLHARLATASRDASLVEPLVEKLLTAHVSYVLPIRQQLRSYSAQLTDRLWSMLRNEKTDTQQRFRAALALAEYAGESESESWSEQDLTFVAEQLVSSNAEFQPILRDALRPIHARLLADLGRIFAEPAASDAQRLSAANAFADYSADDIETVSELLADATPEQYDVLYPIVAAKSAPITGEILAEIAATLPPEELGSVERVPFGQRRANAAVTLLRLGEREKVLPVFEMTDDPESLTQFIFRCQDRGVGVEPLLDCLELVRDAPKDRYPTNTRYALLLGLGEYSLEEIPKPRRETLMKQLADWYGNDPSSGVHGATGWLLRQWGQIDVVRQVDQTPVAFLPDREWFTLAITVFPTPKTFYYTFIVFPPGEYTIGSVEDEPDRFGYQEQRHGVKLTRSFALLDREITFEELIAFKPVYVAYMQQYNAKPVDAGFGADWYDSVAFCRWLGQQSGLSEADQAYAAPETLDREAYPREPIPSANWAPRNWPLELGHRGFRLPTESEWEVASRSGARTTFCYGSDTSLLKQFGWFLENSGKHMHPSRELRPSVRGLFDLHGNSFEWTHDWYYAFGREVLTDPLGGDEISSNRVYRGGSWGNGAAICRTAYRSTVVPTYRTFNCGFRLALSPSVESPKAEAEQ